MPLRRRRAGTAPRPPAAPAGGSAALPGDRSHEDEQRPRGDQRPGNATQDQAPLTIAPDSFTPVTSPTTMTSSPASSSVPGATAIPATGFPVLDAAFDKAVAIPSAVVHAHVDRIRRRNPMASPAQVLRLLEKQYLLAVSASGGAVGAAAAAPAVGTGVGIALTSSEIATFFATSAAFALAVADVHGIAVEDTARRRTLLLATVLGEQGAKTVGIEAGIGTTAWARTLLVNMPTSTIKRVNTALTRRILRRQATKQGALAMGRLAPFGIGAVIGATGARALGRTVVTGAYRAFGPPPPAFTRPVDIVVDRKAARQDGGSLPGPGTSPDRALSTDRALSADQPPRQIDGPGPIDGPWTTPR